MTSHACTGSEVQKKYLTWTYYRDFQSTP